MATRIEASTSLSTSSEQNIVATAKGGGIVFAGNLFELGSRFVVSVLLARLLGAEQLGLCNLALSAFYITARLVTLELPSAMVRYVSLYASRRDTAGLWGTLQIGLGLTAVLSVPSAVGLYLLADPIAKQFFHEPGLAPLLRVTSLAVPFLALTGILVTALQGFKKLESAAIGQNISQPTVRLVLTLLLAVSVGLNAKRALIAFDLSVMVSFVLLVYFLNKLFSLKRPLRAARCDARELLRFSLPDYLSALIQTFGSNLQEILLGVLNTAATVGIFAVANQVNLVGQLFHRSIVAASGPMVSELHDRGEREEFRRFYQTVSKWTFTANLPLFLIIQLFPVSILSIFGQSFVGGTTALTILAAANLVNSGTGICEVVVHMTGNTMLKLVNSIVVLAIALGLNLLLIPVWGLTGAAVAALAAVTTLNLLGLVEVSILFRLLPYNFSFLKPVAAGLAALVVTGGMRRLALPDTNFLHLTVGVAILLAVYAGMLSLLGFSQEDRMVLAHLGRRAAAVLSKEAKSRPE